MSESFITFNNDQISTAEQQISRRLTEVSSAAEYIDTLEESYRDVSFGTASLLRMKRSAMFIRQHDSVNPGHSALALYRGELLASHFLDYLSDTEAMGGDLAHAYIQHRLAKAMPLTKEHEPQINLLSRHSAVAEMISNELEGAHPGLRFLDRYKGALEQHIERLAPEQFRSFARSGFRLVMLEALMPSKLSDIQLTLDTYEAPATTPVHLATPSEGPSSTTISEELRALDAELGNPQYGETFEDISRIKNILRDSYKKSLLSFKEIGLHDDESGLAIKRYTETTLNAQVKQHNFLQEGELLSLNGTYFARATQPGSENEPVGFILLDGDKEVRGKYSGITLIDAPTNRELRRMTKKSIDLDDDAPLRRVTVPALRIVEPVIITFGYNGQQTSEIGIYESLEIPLTYKDYSIERPA